MAKVIDKAGIDRTGGNNMDAEVVNDFGAQWKRFDHSGLLNADLVQMFDGYSHIFPWATLPADAEGADICCGNGRWAVMVVPRVGRLRLVDPSEALGVARQARRPGQQWQHGVPQTVRELAVLRGGQPRLRLLARRAAPGARYARGHRVHCPRAQAGCASAAGAWRPVARQPWPPAARMAAGLLSRPHLYVMRPDALDPFGTQLEKRFTRRELERMLQDAGFERIIFSSPEPFWCAVGFRAAISATTGSASGAGQGAMGATGQGRVTP